MSRSPTPSVRQRTPRCPSHYPVETQRLYKRLMEGFTLRHDFELEIIWQALDQHSRIVEARKILAEEGLTCPDSRGALRAHPAVGIERQFTVAFQRTLKLLGYKEPNPDGSPRRKPGRPPGKNGYHSR